jgi:type 2A phosphatase activator TIP41
MNGPVAGTYQDGFCRIYTNLFIREKTHEGIKEVVKPFDWSYTTDYKGTITKGKHFDIPPLHSAEPIPIDLLKRPDPILFFEEVVLYESELDDNGISIVSCKIRVMPDRMLLLCRLFMRLDNVLVRIRDTRIYVDFNTGKIIRDYTEKEDHFGTVNEVSYFRSDQAHMINEYSESLDLREVTTRFNNRSA